MQSVVYKKIPRIDASLIERAKRINVADLHEALGPVVGRQCLMRPEMRAIFPAARVCGQAITSFNFPGDNLMLHAAFRVAELGDVLVLRMAVRRKARFGERSLVTIAGSGNWAVQ